MTAASEAIDKLRKVLFLSEIAEGLGQEDKGEQRRMLVKAVHAGAQCGVNPSALKPVSFRRAAENALKFRA